MSPDEKHVSTSFVERQNLTMRMHMRRFTRLPNGFSKKVDNHAAAMALHFMYYNFVKTHQSLRMTPAMAAGVTSSPWTVEDIVRLVEERERRRREEAHGGPRRPDERHRREEAQPQTEVPLAPALRKSSQGNLRRRGLDPTRGPRAGSTPR